MRIRCGGLHENSTSVQQRAQKWPRVGIRGKMCLVEESVVGLGDVGEEARPRPL